MNITILGTGVCATALGKAFARKNHQLYFGSRTPETKKEWAATISPSAKVLSYQEAAASSDVIIVAIPWPGDAVHDALAAAGSLAGKILIDATNVLLEDYSPRYFENANSGAEEIARLYPEAKVFKAFNSVSGHTLGDNLLQFGDTSITGFYCGDDEEAKKIVGQLGDDAGLKSLYAGPLKNARHLESLGHLMISLAFGQGLGVDVGWAYLQR